jgi:flagellin-like hook-associated protein FlgL
MAVNTFLRDLNLNDEALLKIQTALASGKIISKPSDDPVKATGAIGYEYYGKRLDVSLRNMESARSFLSTAESSFDDLQLLIQDARSIAVYQGSDTASAASRLAAADVINAKIDAIIEAANQQFRSRFLFAGTNTGTAPYERTANGVIYRGNDEGIPVEISPASLLGAALPGSEVFGSLSTRAGGADVNPAIYLGEAGGYATAASLLNGGNGVSDGRIEITYSGGRVDVDLSALRDLADLKQRIESATGGVVTVGYNPAKNGLLLTDTGGGPLLVRDLAGGQAALSLGIRVDSMTGSISGGDLDPVVSWLTRLADFNGGAGVDTSGFTVTHDGVTYTIATADLTGSVQDLINAFNRQGDGAFMQINSAGNGLEVVGRVSSQSLTVATSGGTAGSLGIPVGAVQGDDLFATLIALRDALAGNNTAGITAAIGRIDTSHDRLLDVRGRIGSRLQRLDDAKSRLTAEKSTVSELLSNLVDADVAELAVRFSERKNATEAALKAAAQILPLSLIDFL